MTEPIAPPAIGVNITPVDTQAYVAVDLAAKMLGAIPDLESLDDGDAESAIYAIAAFSHLVGELKKRCAEAEAHLSLIEEMVVPGLSTYALARLPEGKKTVKASCGDLVFRSVPERFRITDHRKAAKYLQDRCAPADFESCVHMEPKVLVTKIPDDVCSEIKAALKVGDTPPDSSVSSAFEVIPSSESFSVKPRGLK